MNRFDLPVLPAAPRSAIAALLAAGSPGVAASTPAYVDIGAYEVDTDHMFGNAFDYVFDFDL